VADEIHPPMPRWTLLIGVVALAVVDIASKYVVFAILGEPQYAAHDKALIPGFLYMTTRYNTGFSWGMFRGIPGLLSAFINLGILGAVGYVFFFTRRIPVNRWTVAVGMLVMGGALGNLYDRIFHTGVRDFIDFVIPLVKFDYPVFNAADVFIVAGVIIVFLEPYLNKRHTREEVPDG